jgi:hypothetical protein
MMSLDLYVISAILFSHWMADFPAQTDWMAKNKSSNNRALSMHILVYTAFLAVMIVVCLGKLSVAWLLLNAGLHWATDWCTSRITKRLWAAGDVHNFFVVIGADQLIHAMCLLWTAAYML